MPDKPDKWGVKVWMVVDSAGYLYAFEIYTGADKEEKEKKKKKKEKKRSGARRKRSSCFVDMTKELSPSTLPNTFIVNEESATEEINVPELPMPVIPPSTESPSTEEVDTNHHQLQLKKQIKIKEKNNMVLVLQ